MALTKLESRVGSVAHPKEVIYNFLSDFRNLEKFLPADRVRDWKAEEDSCTFKITGLGDAGMRMVEKEPYEHIKITGDGPYSIDFFFWIQIKEVEQDESRIKLTLQAELNAMMNMMAKKPLEEFLDMMVGVLEKYDYGQEGSR